MSIFTWQGILPVNLLLGWLKFEAKVLNTNRPQDKKISWRLYASKDSAENPITSWDYERVYSEDMLKNLCEDIAKTVKYFTDKKEVYLTVKVTE